MPILMEDTDVTLEVYDELKEQMLDERLAVYEGMAYRAETNGDELLGEAVAMIDQMCAALNACGNHLEQYLEVLGEDADVSDAIADEQGCYPPAKRLRARLEAYRVEMRRDKEKIKALEEQFFHDIGAKWETPEAS